MAARECILEPAKINRTWKIIAVMKNRGIRKILSFSAVPSGWLTDNNTSVFWPSNQQETLRRDASSIPENGWKKYNCLLKRDNITNFDEAMLWEQEYVAASDTEAEER